MTRREDLHLPWQCVSALVALTVCGETFARTCSADLDGDGRVDGADLGRLLVEWGPCGSAPCLADFDANSAVDGGDLASMLTAWGECPTVTIPPWATLVEASPDPNVVTDPALRAAIVASGFAWRVRDTATQIEMLFVPTGSFTMGCVQAVTYPSGSCPANELPVREVTLTRPYYLGRFEVTQREWTNVWGSNPSFHRPINGFPDSDNRPVERVDWIIATEFAQMAGMRLPTEAEWEHACRAGSSAPFYDGATDWSTVAEIGWFEGCASCCVPCIDGNAEGRTHIVGGKLANALGFHDMAGNVGEWVADRWGQHSELDTVDPTGPATGTNRITRGGSFTDGWSRLRSSARLSRLPGYVNLNTGLRVARDP